MNRSESMFASIFESLPARARIDHLRSEWNLRRCELTLPCLPRRFELLPLTGLGVFTICKGFRWLPQMTNVAVVIESRYATALLVRFLLLFRTCSRIASAQDSRRTVLRIPCAWNDVRELRSEQCMGFAYFPRRVGQQQLIGLFSRSCATNEIPKDDLGSLLFSKHIYLE